MSLATITTSATADLLTSPSSKAASISDSERETINQLKYVVWGVIGSTLAVVGFLGNILSMVVLQQRQMRSSTSYYLLSLAIYDNGVLLGMFFYFILPSLMINSDPANVYLFTSTMPFGYPLSLTAQMGSIYTCVGFTIERFIAVCKPLHVANTCTKSRALRAIFIIFIWSVTYNIPRFFHYRIMYTSSAVSPLNDSLISMQKDNLTVLISTANPPFNTHSLPSGSASTNYVVASDAETMVYPGYYHATSMNAGNDSHSIAGDLAGEKITLSFERRGDKGSRNGGHTNEASETAASLPNPTSSLRRVPPNNNPRTNRSAAIAETTSPETPPSSGGSGGGTARKHETDFGKDPIFKHVYLVYSYLFFMFLLPFLIILVMNMYLIRAVNRSRSMRQSLSSSAIKEQNLTVMLIAVIVVFLVCQFPTIIDNILLAVMGEAALEQNYSYQVFYTIVSFMVEINAAANFILYCFFGKKFRMVLLAVVGLKKRRKHVAYRSTVFKSRTVNGTRSYDTEVSVV